MLNTITVVVILTTLEVVRSARILSTDDDFVYTNPADTYEPNEYVKYGHMMSRNEEFDSDDYQTYLQNAAYMPGVLAALGILSFLLINLFLFFRCCCKSVACPPNEKEGREVLLKKRFRVVSSFYIIIFLAVAFNSLLYFADHKMGTAVTTFQGSVDDVQTIVNAVITDADDLFDYAGQMATTVGLIGDDIDGCPYLESDSDLASYFQTASETVASFNDTAADLQGETADIDSAFDDFQSDVDKYAGTYRLRAIAALWLIPILVLLLLACTHCCRAKCAMQTTIFLVWLVFLLLILLGALWAFVVTSSSTICMDPIYTLNREAPADMRKYTMYYTACQGESYIESTLNDTITETNTIQAALLDMENSVSASDLETSCPGNQFLAHVDDLQAEVTGVNAEITDVINLTGCATFQAIFFQVINDALCTDFYTGMFFLWGSQLWTNFMLFVVLVLASILWQYYDTWDKYSEVKYTAAAVKTEPESPVDILDGEGSSGGEEEGSVAYEHTAVAGASTGIVVAISADGVCDFAAGAEEDLEVDINHNHSHATRTAYVAVAASATNSRSCRSVGVAVQQEVQMVSL